MIVWHVKTKAFPPSLPGHLSNLIDPPKHWINERLPRITLPLKCWQTKVARGIRNCGNNRSGCSPRDLGPHLRPAFIGPVIRAWVLWPRRTELIEKNPAPVFRFVEKYGSAANGAVRVRGRVAGSARDRRVPKTLIRTDRNGAANASGREATRWMSAVPLAAPTTPTPWRVIPRVAHDIPSHGHDMCTTVTENEFTSNKPMDNSLVSALARCQPCHPTVYFTSAGRTPIFASPCAQSPTPS